ncbi:MAG: DUF3971 domain-containing protein [Janthinobacterium lividum]
MIYKTLKTLTRFILTISLILLTVGCLVFVGLIVRLQQGPVSLDAFHHILEENVQRALPNFKIKLNQPELIWENLDAPFKVKVQSIDIQSQIDNSFHVDVESLSLIYTLNGLWTSGFEPQGIELEASRFLFDGESLAQTQETSKETQDEKLLTTLIHKILASEGKGSSLKSLKINRAEIRVSHLKGGHEWTLPPTDFTFRKTTNKFELYFKTIWQEQEYIFSFSTLDKFKSIDLKFVIPELASNFLKDVPDVIYNDLPDVLQSQLQTLQHNPFTFGLNLKGHYDAEKGIKFAELGFKIREGIIDLPDFLPNPLKITEGVVDASVKDNKILLKTCHAKVGGAILNLQGTGNWLPKTQHLSFKLDNQFQQVTRAFVEDIWLASLARVPRKWIMENIDQAILPETKLQLEGQADFSVKDQPSINISKLQGIFNFKNGIVRYVDELPKATDVQGNGSFDKQELKINVIQAESGGLTLRKGVINIHDLHVKDQTLDMTLEIAAPLPQVIKFIDLPPLYLAQKNDLNKLKCDGYADSIVQIAFPLEVKIEPHEIKTQVSSHITDLSIIKPVPSLDINIHQGDFHLKIDADYASFKGKGLLNKMPADINWQKNLITDQTNLDIDTSLRYNQLKKMGLPSAISFQGDAPAQIKYQESKDHEAIVTLVADLTPIRLSFLNWVKPIQQSGSLNVELSLKNQKLQKINKFLIVSTNQLKIEGEATFSPSPGGTLPFNDVKITQFKAGKNDFKGSLLKKGPHAYEIDISGKSLDLEPFTKDSSDEEIKFPQETLYFNAKFDEVHLNHDHTFFNNTLNFRLQNEQIRFLAFKSYLKSMGRMQNQDQSIMFAKVEPYSGNRRRFTFQTPAAGKLFKAFDLPVQLHEGFLQLYAFKNDGSANNPWRGKMRIQDFSIKNVPTLAKVLTFAFPTGLGDLFSNKGLSFDQMRTNFVLAPDKLFITKGRVQGTSLGMTLRGNVGRGKNQNLHLAGSVIPGYVLNSTLPKIIPFLGEILTGGKHEGIFSVSYSIEGTRADPQVSVNPMSLFTPGFLRKIFEWSSDADDSSDEDDIEDVSGRKTTSSNAK